MTIADVDLTAKPVLLSSVLEQRVIDSITPMDNRDTLDQYRAAYDMGGVSNRVNMLKTNGKLELDTGEGIIAFGLSLNPAVTHGDFDLCAWKTDGCEAACILDFAYQRSDNVRNSRRALTDYLADNTQAFIDHLAWEIEELLGKHGKGNVAIRLNTASDIRWEYFAGALFDKYGDQVYFYDYTKAPFGQRELRDDYTLVYSVSERKRSIENARKYIEAGHSATIVLPIRYRSHSDHDDIPEELKDIVADHDAHDVRALDKGMLGVLRAKGSARSDDTGFVRETKDALAIVQ